MTDGTGQGLPGRYGCEAGMERQGGEGAYAVRGGMVENNHFTLHILACMYEHMYYLPARGHVWSIFDSISFSVIEVALFP